MVVGTIMQTAIPTGWNSGTIQPSYHLKTSEESSHSRAQKYGKKQRRKDIFQYYAAEIRCN